MQFQFVDEPQIAFGIDTVRPQHANRCGRRIRAVESNQDPVSQLKNTTHRMHPHVFRPFF